MMRLGGSESGARYYGSALGRFTSPDVPFADQYAGDPQSWNLYSYVRNNPLRYMDADGTTCSSSKGPNGETIINNVDGKGCAELYDNNVYAFDGNPGLAVLASVGEKTTDPREWADVARHGVEGAAMVDAGLELPGLLRSGLKGLAALFEDSASALLKDPEPLVNAATAADPADKGGLLTKAGGALQKHTLRPGSRFPSISGNPSAVNQQAKEIVQSILSDPGKTAEFSETGRFGRTLDVYGSNGQGVRYSADGKTFIGFINR